MLRILIILLFSQSMVFAQSTGVNFFLDTYVRKNLTDEETDSSSFADVFITVPNSELYFKNVDKSYLSKIEFIVEIMNEDDNSSITRNIKRNHLVDEYLKNSVL